VKVTLVVRKQTTLPLRPITLVNQVRLPNVDYQTTEWLGDGDDAVRA